MRSWMGVLEDNYTGFNNLSPRPEQIAAFNEAFVQRLEDQAPNNSDHLVDLLEELVAMNTPLLAIKLVDAYPNLFPSNDFRAQLHLGNAAMLVSDLARAESAFIDAQRLVPEEPAPYVNLAEIYCHDGLFDHAKKWCEAGLEAESNHTRLWELIAWIEQQNSGDDASLRESVINKIKTLAEQKNSWAGTALACDLRNPEDVLTKAKALDVFFFDGCRDEDFLIEYTAVLGMAGQYDKIPPIVWQFEKQTSSKSQNWQLTMHMVQAFMGLGRDEDARENLKKLVSRDDIPPAAVAAITALKQELGDQAKA
jgi:tetratricopeptide (TPR) repeat protein